MRIFSPQIVIEMTKDQLENVACEELHLKRRREQLEKKNENLADDKPFFT